MQKYILDYSGCGDRFIVDKRLVKEKFVDEKLCLG
jgi:hypothetical protein